MVGYFIWFSSSGFEPIGEICLWHMEFSLLGPERSFSCKRGHIKANPTPCTKQNSW
jgi:hypothetical protein